MKKIYLILHGFNQQPKLYEDLSNVIKEKEKNATVLIPKFKFNTFSTINPDEIVVSILKLMDNEWKKAVEGKSPMEALPDIILIGHSMGALLVRKLFVAACGENNDAPLGTIFGERIDIKEWATQVKRIVLIAGINRGWSINPHLYTKTALLIRISTIIGNMMKAMGLEPCAFKLRRGATFVTQFRLQWISMLRHSQTKQVGNVPVVHLLGTQDDVISPEDNIDVLIDQNFIYLEVPDSNHLSVLNLTRGSNSNKRKQVFEEAITQSIESLQENQIAHADTVSLREYPEVTDVVFVVHGIRDTGYWTQKIARRVKALGDSEKRIFATETSTYGYFAMLPFLLPFVRRQKVEWLMEQYTENLVLYPNATFSFVGHSNGTYLLAKALKEYPICKFKNVVFAGSVVHKQFEWKKLIKEKRVGSVYNLVASSDWVVAIFPKAFQKLKLQDLGSGGFDGFSEKLENEYQLKYVQGGHGAAIKERYWDDIAYFIVYGKMSEKFTQNVAQERSFFMKLLGAISPLPFLLILGVLLLILWSIIYNYNGFWLYFLLTIYIGYKKNSYFIITSTNLI